MPGSGHSVTVGKLRLSLCSDDEPRSPQHGKFFLHFACRDSSHDSLRIKRKANAFTKTWLLRDCKQINF